MSKSTISTFQLFELFPDEETARTYLEGRLWPSGPTCLTCQSQDRITTRKGGGFYRCNACQLDFTVRTGTVFGRSHIPLHKWIYAMYLLVTARKGISSLQLSKEIGVTQKSAWFMLQRLREACGSDDDIDKLRGAVEDDHRASTSAALSHREPRGWHSGQANHLCGGNRVNTPPELDRIADVVLNYRPKTRAKKARKRKKARRRQARAN